MTQVLRVMNSNRKVNGYLAAAALSLSIGPFTSLAMIPINFQLIKMNQDHGGARSEKSAQKKSDRNSYGENNPIDSVNGKNEAAEFRDISGPQTQVDGRTTAEDDQKVRELLSRFSALNFARAVLIGGGGIVGLITALA